MCVFGCDSLFEKGYISVSDGKVVPHAVRQGTSAIRKYVKRFEPVVSAHFPEGTRKYFDWHRDFFA